MFSKLIKRLDAKRTRRVVPHQLYGTLVAQSRLPVFYTDFQVPDTLDGRFDMLVMHMFVFSHHMANSDQTLNALSQDVFDNFISDMERGMRQEGVGDTSIPKKLKKMTRVFYGRVGAYEAPLEAQDSGGLAKVVDRNLFVGGSNSRAAGALADYMLQLATDIAAVDRQEMLRGKMEIAAPVYPSHLNEAD